MDRLRTVPRPSVTAVRMAQFGPFGGVGTPSRGPKSVLDEGIDRSTDFRLPIAQLDRAAAF